MKVELAVSNVRGEVLDVERLLLRQPDAAQFGVGFRQYMFRQREIRAGEQTDKASVDRVGRRARQLLENDRPRQRLETLAPRLEVKRPDLGNDPCEDGVSLAKMRPGFARIVDFAGCHLTEKIAVRRILHA